LLRLAPEESQAPGGLRWHRYPVSWYFKLFSLRKSFALDGRPINYSACMRENVSSRPFLKPTFGRPRNSMIISAERSMHVIIFSRCAALKRGCMRRVNCVLPCWSCLIGRREAGLTRFGVGVWSCGSHNFDRRGQKDGCSLVTSHVSYRGRGRPNPAAQCCSRLPCGHSCYVYHSCSDNHATSRRHVCTKNVP
jgi:hypothetical protein